MVADLYLLCCYRILLFKVIDSFDNAVMFIHLFFKLFYTVV